MRVVFLLAAVVVVMVGCTRDKELYVMVTNESQATDVTSTAVNNCGGAAEITSEVTYDLRISVQGSGDLGVDVAAVSAKIAGSLGVQAGYTIRQTVRTPPGMQGEHRASVELNVVEGFVSRKGSRARATYVVRMPQSFVSVTSSLEKCPGSGPEDGDSSPSPVVNEPKAHAWRCSIEITDRETNVVLGSGELTFGRIADGNALEYGRLFLDTVKLSGMERNMESQTAAWGFMGERTDDVLTFVFPDYRFPAQPFMLLNVTPDQTTGTLELRGDLLFNKPQQSAVGYVSASCRVAD